MTSCRPAAALAGLALALAFTAPAAATERSTVIVSGNGVSGLSAYGGHVVFSKLDRTTKLWRLLQWHAGRMTALPVPPQTVVFDADAGPDIAGHPVVDYSACTTVTAATDATGCHIVELRLDAPGPPTTVPGTDLPGVSATTPSRWRGSLAFGRHLDGSSVTQIMLRRAGTTRPLRHPALLCDVDCDDRQYSTTIESLDLGPHVAAYVWRQDGADTFGIGPNWLLTVAPVDGGRPHELAAGFIDGACGFVSPFAPTATGNGAFWVAAGSPCETTQTVFAESDPTTGRRREAHPAAGVILSASRDGSTVYWLRDTRRPRADILSTGATCTGRANCAIVRSTGVPWRTLRRGAQLGPYPEDP